MNKAYTLIELLVSLSIFSLVIGSASSLFVYSLRAQRDLLQTRTVLDELSYAMEYMSKAIRMAQKDVEGSCVSSTATLLNYKKTQSGQGGIKFKNSQGICQEFYLDSESRLVEEKGKGKDKEINYLTSGNLGTTSFKIVGEGQNDDKQPWVRLFLATPKIKIQTSISQRTLDVQKEEKK